MKKLFYTLLLSLLPLASSAVTQQTYTNPSELPDAFEWDAVRYDYRGTDDNGDPQLVNTQNVHIVWNPNVSKTQNSRTSYGALTIEHFYTSEYLKEQDFSLVFNNFGNLNFEWNEEAGTITASFQYAYISETKSTVNASNKLWKYACVASAKKGNNNYWYDNGTTEYTYNGETPRTIVIDINNKTISLIDEPWGAFVRYQNGGGPSKVLEYYERSTFDVVVTDLVDIVRDKEEGDEVTVADDLLCVAFLPQYSYDNSGNKTEVGNVLVCKDLGKYENPDVNTAGAFDYMHDTVVFPGAYDQSNWVVLTDGNNLFTSTGITGYVNHIIKGGTIKGTFTDKLNPTIALSELPTAGDAQQYTPNTYVVPSFNDEYAAAGSDVFFVRPKPQEYCTVKWANYDAATDAFYVPTSTPTDNVHDLKGAFMWDKTYLGTGAASDRTVYTFNAMVNKMPPATRSYCVWVHALNWQSQLVEDQNNYVYAVMGGKEIFGSFPGKKMTLMRKAYYSDGTQSNWYYLNLGTEKQDGDLIIFSRGSGANQTTNITNFDLGNNFYNYWMDGDGDRYEKLSGYTSIAPTEAGASRRAATAQPDVSSSVSETFVVMPLALEDSSVLTAIADVRSSSIPQQVLYYSPTGMVSTTPFAGVNIVVTRYQDGTTSAVKQMH